MSKRDLHRTACPLAILLCSLTFVGCVAPETSGTRSVGNKPELPPTSNAQASPEVVKNEQFIVPVGSVIPIKGLEFDPGISDLTQAQKRIVQQVFNALEDITENLTVTEPDPARVADYKKMMFEIRGYPDSVGTPEAKLALATARASAVMNYLTYLGTPPRRLKATGLGATRKASSDRPAQNRTQAGRVVFIRTQ